MFLPLIWTQLLQLLCVASCHCSPVPLFFCCFVPLFHFSPVPLFPCSTSRLFLFSSIPLVFVLIPSHSSPSQQAIPSLWPLVRTSATLIPAPRLEYPPRNKDRCRSKSNSNSSSMSNSSSSRHNFKRRG